MEASVAAGSFLLKFQSDITFVDVAVEMIRAVLDYMKVEDTTNILLVSRELLKNAVVHGNQNDGTKEVIFGLHRNSQNRFELEVEDSGPGVDSRNSENACAERDAVPLRNKTGGRGFTIINRLAEQVILNKPGNKVTVLLEL